MADQDNENRLNEMKRLSEQVNWDKPQERYNLLDELDPLIGDWQGEPPNLRDIFQPERIERLLTDAVCHWAESQNFSPIERFVGFVARSGYRHEPIQDSSDNPLRRTTALHHMYARNDSSSLMRSWANVVHLLFQIYHSVELNYVDEKGVSHLRVAGKYNCREFLQEFNQLPPGPVRPHQDRRVQNRRRVSVYNPSDVPRQSPATLHDTQSRTLSQANDELSQLMAKVNSMEIHRTPLQLAVMNRQPNMVKDLLEDDADLADLADFVFPAGHFAEMTVPQLEEDRLRLVSGLLACVERLVEKGYELTRSDARTIARFLDRSANVRLLKSKVISGLWLAERTQEIMIKEGLSVYDLIKQPDLARTRELTATDCYEFTLRTSPIWRHLETVGQLYRLIFAALLSQIMAREFCHRWRTILE